MTLALILGGAQCVWDDVRAVVQMARPDVVIGINDMIPGWPLPLDVAVTLHPAKLPGWLEARRARGLDPPGQCWGHKLAPGIDKATEDWRGSSALLAVKVALVELKLSGVVLAGVPLDRTPHFVRAGPWKDAHTFFAGWAQRRRAIAPKTRAMAGWTRDVFGLPDAAWLASINAAPPDPAMIETLAQAAA